MRHTLETTLIVVAVIGAACSMATPPPPDLTMMRAAQTLDLPGHSRAAILEAIRTVLVLADPDDITIQPTITGLRANRRIGTADPFGAEIMEAYAFHLTEGPAGPQLFMEAAVTYVTMTYYPYTPDVYELLAGRIRAVLGEPVAWETCEMVAARAAARHQDVNAAFRHPYLCHYADDRPLPAPDARHATGSIASPTNHAARTLSLPY